MKKECFVSGYSSDMIFVNIILLTLYNLIGGVGRIQRVIILRQASVVLKVNLSSLYLEILLTLQQELWVSLDPSFGHCGI